MHPRRFFLEQFDQLVATGRLRFYRGVEEIQENNVEWQGVYGGRGTENGVGWEFGRWRNIHIGLAGVLLEGKNLLDFAVLVDGEIGLAQPGNGTIVEISNDNVEECSS